MDAHTLYGDGWGKGSMAHRLRPGQSEGTFVCRGRDQKRWLTHHAPINIEKYHARRFLPPRKKRREGISYAL